MRPKPILLTKRLCRLHDLNTRPSDYKSDALPTELTSLKIIFIILTVPTGIEPAIFAVTGRRDNRYTTGPFGLYTIVNGS